MIASTPKPTTLPSVPLAEGAFHISGFLERPEQEALLAEIRAIARTAPLFLPRMPRTGKPFSVRMTNCGSLGWVSDRDGYRYQPVHPETGDPWPAMPDRLLHAWKVLAPGMASPEACLINYYEPSARMGLHQDRDEEAFDAPVVSLSLGDTCVFRIGGITRKEPTRSIRLASGDAIVFGGASRLAFHGVDRILPGTSTLLKGEGRINLTLRRVTAPDGGYIA